MGDRANLLDDAFALAEAGLVGYDVPLGMVGYLKAEGHTVPWKAANRHLIILGARSAGLPLRKHLQVRSSFALLRSSFKDIVAFFLLIRLY